MKFPIGYDDFKEIIDKKLTFIDKTLFIKDILEDSAKAILITRPRRFGKTLNLSMLYYFLTYPQDGQPTSHLFEELKITHCGEEYLQHQGCYPVVSITFKDIKENSYAKAQKSFAMLMSELYLNYHDDLLSSSKLKPQHKQNFQKIVQKRADEAQLKSALKDLMHYLYLHYGVKPWLLLDEYDTPIHEAYAGKYYNKMIDFMRGVLGAALKNNPYLEKAVITGILRVAKESLFSGLNNLKVYSLLHERYSEYFGFTESEVQHILQQSNLSDKAADIQHWYNGYSFGNTIIYNPWSIANCIQEKGLTQPYWVNTSGNELIQDLLQEAPLNFKAHFEHLMQGETIEQLMDENMVFADLKKNEGVVWSLLLMSGYLTVVSHQSVWNGYVCQLRVPNQEVNNLYRMIIGRWLSKGEGLMWYLKFTQALATGDIETFHQGLEKVLTQIVSYHDAAKEPKAFFHGLLLGFIANLQETHEIQSNRESGFGRYDIALFPKDATQLGVIIELKAKSPTDKASLEKLAEQALTQIQTQHYDAAFASRGIHTCLHLAIAFQGKRFALRFVNDIKNLSH